MPRGKAKRKYTRRQVVSTKLGPYQVGDYVMINAPSVITGTIKEIGEHSFTMTYDDGSEMTYSLSNGWRTICRYAQPEVESNGRSDFDPADMTSASNSESF